MENLKVTS